MTPAEALLVGAAGLGAGTINAVVGSGTLITFPALLAVGYPPVLANVSNTVGLVPGSLSAAIGYRAELAGQGRRLVGLGGAAVLGGIVGALLLLNLPSRAFEIVVPALIGIACVLVLVQTRLARWVRRHPDRTPRAHRPLLYAGIFGTGIYGGYFGAAQGVLLVAIMGLLLDDSLQRLNAAKNVLALLVNGIAALVFVAVTDVAWEAVALIAGGSVIGGQLGALIGRRLPDPVLRAVVVTIGGIALVLILLK